ncbi:MAG: serine--tRNA ligase [bacterium]|nr:serine--tRNA ligase [bacterium]
MLDIAFIRENPDLIKEAARKKHIDFDVNALIDLDKDRRTRQARVEQLRAEKNQSTEAVVAATTDSEREAIIKEVKGLKKRLTNEEVMLTHSMKNWREMMLRVPNIPDFSVPEGEYDVENKEVRSWGERPVFDFEPKDHITLMQQLDMVDFERGVKLSGFRGYILKGMGMRLQMALWNFAFDQLIKKGFTPLGVPSLVRREAFVGTGYLPQSEDDLYKTQDDLYLSGTAEVPAMGMFMGDVIEKKELPLKFVAFSPSYRREAGSHGKDTKGLIRVHEFFKVEQIIISEASHQMSVALHEELSANVDDLMQQLGIPYRVVVNCGGDLGLGQVKKYDVEAWVPAEGKYRETHSCSYFHDFQTRRLNIRYIDDDGKKRFAHSLNNTAVATPRLLVSIIENFQTKESGIVIPEVLRPYMGVSEIKPVAQTGAHEQEEQSEQEAA